MARRPRRRAACCVQVNAQLEGVYSGALKHALAARAVALAPFTDEKSVIRDALPRKVCSSLVRNVRYLWLGNPEAVVPNGQLASRSLRSSSNF